MQTVGFALSPSIRQQQPSLSSSSLRKHLAQSSSVATPGRGKVTPGPPSLPSTPKAQGGSCSKTPAQARVPAALTERLPFGPNHRCPFSPAQLQKSGFIYINIFKCTHTRSKTWGRKSRRGPGGGEKRLQDPRAWRRIQPRAGGGGWPPEERLLRKQKIFFFLNASGWRARICFTKSTHSTNR